MLTFETAPSFTGPAQIGADLIAVAGVVTGGVAPYNQTVFSIEESADGSTWTERSTVSPVPITAADNGISFRFVNTFVDSAGSPETITLTTAVLGPVSTDIPFFDCTLGGTRSTSYVCLEEAELILQTNLQSSGLVGWSELSDNDKKRSLNLASSVITPLDWKGEKCSCEQALAWPRIVNDCTCEMATCNAIPYDIKYATAFLGASLAAGSGSIGSIGGGGGSGSNSGQGGSGGGGGVEGLEPFQSVTLGPINVVMKSDAEFVSSSAWGWDALPAFVQSLLSKWLQNGAGIGGIGQGVISRQSVARMSARKPGQVLGQYSLRGNRVYPRYSQGW